MHMLIIGKTMSGKTTLAKKKSHALKKQYPQRFNLVLDPLLDPDWNADFITSDPAEFLGMVWANENCNLFIDEAGLTVGKYNTAMDEIATRSRHHGHKAFFICQRAKMISTTVRTQCTDLAIFKNSPADTEDLANEFVEPMINEAHKLEHGDFILVRHGHKPLKANVFKL